MSTLVVHPGLHHAGMEYMHASLRAAHNMLGASGVTVIDPAEYGDALRAEFLHLDENPDPGLVHRVQALLSPILEERVRRGYETIVLSDPFLGGERYTPDDRRLYPGFEARMQTLFMIMPNWKKKAFLSLPLAGYLLGDVRISDAHFEVTKKGLNPARLLGVLGTLFGRDKIGVSFFIPDHPEEAFYRFLEFLGIDPRYREPVSLPKPVLVPQAGAGLSLAARLEDRFGAVMNAMVENPSYAAKSAPI